MTANNQFFDMHRATEMAIAKWGDAARTWNRDQETDPDERCQIGTGGCGMPHVVYGKASNWLDAARNAGLL